MIELGGVITSQQGWRPATTQLSRWSRGACSEGLFHQVCGKLQPISLLNLVLHSQSIAPIHWIGKDGVDHHAQIRGTHTMEWREYSGRRMPDARGHAGLIVADRHRY